MILGARAHRLHVAGMRIQVLDLLQNVKALQFKRAQSVCRLAQSGVERAFNGRARYCGLLYYPFPSRSSRVVAPSIRSSSAFAARIFASAVSGWSCARSSHLA